MNPADRPTGAERGLSPNRNAGQPPEVSAQEARRNRRALEAAAAPDERNVRQRADSPPPNAVAQADIFAEIGHSLPDLRPDRPPAARAPHAPPSPPPVNYLVSVQDGRVGSLYSETGRIRMTHSEGPFRSIEPAGSIQRFNINFDEAKEAYLVSGHDSLFEAFEELDPNLTDAERDMAIDDAFDNAHQRWIGEVLAASGDPPDWAQRVDGHQDVPHINDVDPNSGFVLFEVHKNAEGHLSATHLSRGQAAHMPMRASTLHAIDNALRAIEGETDPNLRNQLFYANLQDDAPDFANRVRTPSP